jgi:hypothetical protein
MVVLEIELSALAPMAMLSSSSFIHHNRNNSPDDYFVETKQRNQKKGEVKQEHPNPPKF